MHKILIPISALLTASALQAAVIVDFSPATTAVLGDNTNSNRKYPNSASGMSVATSGTLDAFSLSNQFVTASTTAGAVDDRMPRLVGGLYASATDNNSANPLLYWEANGVAVRFRTTLNTGEEMVMKALLLTQQADWLAQNTGTASFDTSTVLTLGTSDNGGSYTTQARYIVLNNGTYYASENISAENVMTLNLNTDTNWATFDPTLFQSTAWSGLTYTARSASFFDDVQAVGYYLQGNSTGIAPQFRITEFTATAIPEPSSIVLFGITLCTALLGLRRRYK